MSPALASHHTRVAGDDRAPELLVVGHAAIVERSRPALCAVPPSMPALGGLESGRRIHLQLDDVLAMQDHERDEELGESDRRGADERGLEAVGSTRWPRRRRTRSRFGVTPPPDAKVAPFRMLQELLGEEPRQIGR